MRFTASLILPLVALRKESVDRNIFLTLTVRNVPIVALRKESVDRNLVVAGSLGMIGGSLSARRAWIEIARLVNGGAPSSVALRKESVDRNTLFLLFLVVAGVALRKESVDRNSCWLLA